MLEKLLAELNPRQREAAESLKGPLLVLAGAGSGKTRTLTFRIANLLHHGVAANDILAVTFTNKAAQEMKQRVEKILSRKWMGVALGTFHSICVRILRQEAHHLGLDNDFTIFDQADQTALVREILKDLELDSTRHHPRAILATISAGKNRKVDPNRLAGAGYFEDIVANVYKLYQKKLKDLHGFDFDDLLLETVRLFDEHSKVRLMYEEKFKYVLVDEYQDVNQVQYRLIKLLTQNHRNLCVVGDDDQSIYSFRGADVGLILRFEEDYPDAKVIRLEQNYRSTSTILNAANSIASHNRRRKPKKLWTENPDGDKVIFHEAPDGREEARFVVEEISKSIRRENRSLKDFVVLYRANAQSRAIEETLLQHGIPYRLIGGVRFYDRKEIKDILSYLKVLVNPYDVLSLRRCINAPTRGVGAVTFKRLEDFALPKSENLLYALMRLDEIPDIKGKTKQALSGFIRLFVDLIRLKKEVGLTELVKYVLEKSKYIEALEAEGDAEAANRIENCQELLSVTHDFQIQSEDRSLEAFLFHVSLLSDTDSLDVRTDDKESVGKNVDSVTLMTIHSAKGLEFPIVFLIGLEEGIFPHNRSLLVESDIEEERRLAYVAVTRAMEKLYLVRAVERTLFGMTNFGEPSRFLKEIPKELVTFHSQHGDDGKASWHGAGMAVKLRPGDRLQHGEWGKGIVIQRNETQVTVAFEAIGIKRLFIDEALELRPQTNSTL
jgi:DNA helicase-2/ATP-dependent DNA helicase PcrA